MIIFTDEVIGQFKRDIASHAPERGGALLGPRHTNLVSCFLFDPQAKVTIASYSPSVQLIERVKQEELATGLTFKGIVHSHPGGMDRPSQADLFAFASNLAANSRMGSFIAPIISRGTTRTMRTHEVALGNDSKLSCFEAYRPNADKQNQQMAVIEEVPVTVMAIDEAVSKLKKVLTKELSVSFKATKDAVEINGLVHLMRTLNCRLFQLDLFFPHSFPCAPPIALFSVRHKGMLTDAQDLQFPWGITCFEIDALARQLAPIITEKTKEKARGYN